MLNLKPLLFWRKRRREYLYDDHTSGKKFFFFVARLLLVGLLILTLGVVSLLYISNARADNTVQHLSDVQQGSLLTRSPSGDSYQTLPLLDTKVDIKVAGMIARSLVRQQFTNPGVEWIEAVYVFPLPEDAAVDRMRIRIGERVIEASIKPRQEAKAIYQAARQEGKKASLIEQQRANLFTNSVANIAPGETISVEIEYQQALRFDQGRFSLRFPMAMTPRYIPGKPINESISLGTGWAVDTDQVPDASHITPPVHTGPTPINPVSISIALDAGFPLQQIDSPYHPVHQQTDASGIIHISLAEGRTASDRDFELNWTPQTGHAPRAAFFSETVDNDDYHLLMLMPPQESTYDAQSLARDVVYVIDTSGSMHGSSIEQAKQALLLALDRLRLHDRFNIIQFNSTTHQLFGGSSPASFDNIARARRYVQSLVADGGTEIAPALQRALSQPSQDNMVKQVIFLTDGSVGNESSLFTMINRQLGTARLFTIGIGSAPNSYFMRKAAHFGRGSYTYISDTREVGSKMQALFSKLENPVMTDLSISFDGDSKAEIWPQRIPDLYHGEPMMLAIRTDRPITEIQVKGQRALSPWSTRLAFSAGKQSPGVAGYWARHKIAALMDSLHEGADKHQVREEVTEVALRHQLVSRYTSLVAVEQTPSRPVDDNLKTSAVPVNLPAGQNYRKIMPQLAQTATSATRDIIFGSTLLLLALLSQLWSSRHGKRLTENEKV